MTAADSFGGPDYLLSGWPKATGSDFLMCMKELMIICHESIDLIKLGASTLEIRRILEESTSQPPQNTDESLPARYARPDNK